jgi:hypothetical protein
VLDSASALAPLAKRLKFRWEFWDTSGTYVAIEKTKAPGYRGLLERMNGLEPSTFCMASRRSTN